MSKQLRISQRLALALFGLTCVGGGFLSIFQGHEGATTATLGVMGGAVVLLAIFGRLPTKVKLGDNSLEFGAEEVVDATLSALPDVSVSDVVATLDSVTSPVAALVVRRAEEHLEFHKDVLRVVRTIENSNDVSVTLRRTDTDQQMWDAVIEHSNGRRVLLEAVLKLDETSSLIVSEWVQPYIRDSETVLIVYKDITDSAVQSLALHGVVGLFDWREGAVRLVALVGRLLTD